MHGVAGSLTWSDSSLGSDSGAWSAQGSALALASWLELFVYGGLWLRLCVDGYWFGVGLVMKGVPQFASAHST